MSKKNKIGKSQNYNSLFSDIELLLQSSKRTSARAVNIILTVTYWKIGRRIVEYEQQGSDRAEYGKRLLANLSNDLTSSCGKGFSVDNLESMRLFYLAFDKRIISETMSRKSQKEPKISATLSRNFEISISEDRFPLSWSHYVMLTRRVKDEQARIFYETESLRNGWSVRQLDRQISSQFYERTLLSKNKAAMLKKAGETKDKNTLTQKKKLKIRIF